MAKEPARPCSSQQSQPQRFCCPSLAALNYKCRSNGTMIHTPSGFPSSSSPSRYGKYLLSIAHTIADREKMSSLRPLTRTTLAAMDEKPADLNIPDNYVAYTLRNQKPLPPITWRNWYKEIDYISVAALTLTPTIAIYGMFTVKLQWQTAVWSFIYYFVTGLGTFSWSFIRLHSSDDAYFRYHCGLSPSLGAPGVQRVQGPPIFSCPGGCWRRPGLHQVVVAWPSRPSSLHRH